MKRLLLHILAIWCVPIAETAIILLAVFASAAVAVYAPAKRIRNMAITATINDM